MNQYNDRLEYEAFVEVLADILLEQLPAAMTERQELEDGDRNESGA